jgi:hypothetical protein
MEDCDETHPGVRVGLRAGAAGGVGGDGDRGLVQLCAAVPGPDLLLL